MSERQTFTAKIQNVYFYDLVLLDTHRFSITLSPIHRYNLYANGTTNKTSFHIYLPNIYRYALHVAGETTLKLGNSALHGIGNLLVSAQLEQAIWEGIGSIEATSNLIVSGISSMITDSLVGTSQMGVRGTIEEAILEGEAVLSSTTNSGVVAKLYLKFEATLTGASNLVSSWSNLTWEGAGNIEATSTMVTSGILEIRVREGAAGLETTSQMIVSVTYINYMYDGSYMPKGYFDKKYFPRTGIAISEGESHLEILSQLLSSANIQEATHEGDTNLETTSQLLSSGNIQEAIHEGNINLEITSQLSSSANVQEATHEGDTNLEITSQLLSSGNIQEAIHEGASSLISVSQLLSSGNVEKGTREGISEIQTQSQLTTIGTIEQAIFEGVSQLNTLSNMNIIGNSITTQYLRPIGDIATNGWTYSSGSTLYGAIDETSYSDADYIQNNAVSYCEVSLSSGSDPLSSAGHIVRYRYGRSRTDRTLTLVVRLYQGSTEIASWTHTDPSLSFAAAEQTLSGAQADSITDYTNLRLRFDITALQNTQVSGQVSWAEMEC